MDKDFSQYSKIVNDFRGQVLKSDFDTKYSAATQNLPKTERFLLKMELKRLAAPCTRLVDLRGHVDGECRQYEHEERIHYLDDLAIKVFEENIAYYGNYTFGVYEAVMNTENNFRVIYQRDKSASSPVSTETNKVVEKNQYPAKLVYFGDYSDRTEERMNFAIAVKVKLSDGKELDATSSDISISGCKFRLNEIADLKVGDTLAIVFTGLEQEFQFGKKDVFNYLVRNIQIVDTTQLVGVQRVVENEGELDGFQRFLKGFIQGNKRRYKINLDNTISAIQARSFEQFILPKMNELPIFMEQKESVLVPRFALTCNNNQSTYQYWQDEKNDSTLNFLITPERIEKLKKAASHGKSLLVYSFIHKSQNKFYFYTADEKQLDDDIEFMRQFLGFAADKSSFAITMLSILDVAQDKAFSPLTLADTLTKKNEYLNLRPDTDVTSTIKTLPYIVVASDITNNQQHIDYKKLSFNNIDITKLKKFGHKRLVDPVIVDEIGVNYKNQRQEARFLYNTDVVIEAEGVTWKGTTRDFSMSGLKIELDKSAVLVKGDIVYLSFPKLQKVTSAFDLKKLPYEIMRINKKKTILNLRVFVEQHQHVGRSFFKALIEKNRDKLKADEYAMMTPGQTKALRNLYGYCANVPNIMVQTSGSRYKREAIALTDSVKSNFVFTLQELSDREHFCNLYPLLSHQQAPTVLNATLKKMQETDAPIIDTFYIAINPAETLVDKSVTTKLESELETRLARKTFIRNALKKGYFFCVQLTLSRTDEPDMEHLNPELSYISSYAIHRGKQIEQDIVSVAGVMQMYDITHEVLLRNKLLDEGS